MTHKIFNNACDEICQVCGTTRNLVYIRGGRTVGFPYAYVCKKCLEDNRKKA